MGIFQTNSEVNKSAKTFPSRWNAIEMSLAEAIGVQPDVEFNGVQVVKPNDNGAANGVCNLDSAGKVPLGRIYTVESNNPANRVPVTDSNGLIPFSIVSPSVYKYSSYQIRYGSFSSCWYWNYGLYMLNVLPFVYDISQENYLATDPQSGLQTIYLPPGKFHVIIDMVPILSLNGTPQNNTSRIDLWITPFMSIDPLIHLPDTIVDDGVYIYHPYPLHWIMGPFIANLHYVVDAPNSYTWIKFYVGRIMSQAGDPVITGATAWANIAIIRVG